MNLSRAVEMSCVNTLMVNLMALPVWIDDLAESQLTAHLEVALVLMQVTGGALRRIHLTVLVWLIQGFDELTWDEESKQCGKPHLAQTECSLLQHCTAAYMLRLYKLNKGMITIRN